MTACHFHLFFQKSLSPNPGNEFKYLPVISRCENGVRFLFTITSGNWTHWKMSGGVDDCREGTYFQFQAWLNLFFVDFSDLSEATPQSSCIIDIARSRYILRTVFWWSSKSWCLFKLFISVEYIFYGLTSFSSCVVCKFFVVYCVSTWELFV